MRKLIWNFIICLSLVSLKTFAGDIYKDKCEMLHYQLREGEPTRDFVAAVNAVCDKTQEGDAVCAAKYSKCVSMAYAEAAAIPYPKEVRLLEAAHFDIGEKDWKGKTALYEAVDLCNPAEVLNLRLFGADNSKPPPDFNKLRILAKQNITDIKNMSPYPPWTNFNKDHTPKTEAQRTPDEIKAKNERVIKRKKLINKCELTQKVLNLSLETLNGWAEDIKQKNSDEVHGNLIKLGFDDNCKTEISRDVRRDIKDLDGESIPKAAPISEAERKHCQDPKTNEDEIENRNPRNRSEVDSLIIIMYRLRETQAGIFRSDTSLSTSVQTGK